MLFSLICSILSLISSSTVFHHEESIKFLRNIIDAENSPEKVFLIDQTDIFLYKLELAPISPSEDRYAILEGWFEVIRQIIESDAINERTVNIISFLMKDYDWFSFRSSDLTSIVLRMFVNISRQTGLDILQMMPDDTINNQSILSDIYHKMIATIGTRQELRFQYSAPVEFLEETRRSAHKLYEHYKILQVSNPDVLVVYYPMKMLMENRETDPLIDVNSAIKAMNLVFPIHRVLFQRFYLDYGFSALDRLFRLVYTKIRIDPNQVESILRDLVVELDRDRTYDSVAEILRTAEQSVDSITGKEMYPVEQFVSYGISPLMSPQAVGLRAVISRFANTNTLEILSRALIAWSERAAPSQIQQFSDLIESRRDLTAEPLHDLANTLAFNFGIDLYDFDYINRDEPWHSQYLKAIISRDPRFSFHPIPNIPRWFAEFLTRRRRVSLGPYDDSMSVVISALLDELKYGRGINEALISRVDGIRLCDEVRSALFCGIQYDCAENLIQYVVGDLPCHQVFDFLNPKTVLNLIYETDLNRNREQIWRSLRLLEGMVILMRRLNFIHPSDAMQSASNAVYDCVYNLLTLSPHHLRNNILADSVLDPYLRLFRGDPQIIHQAIIDIRNVLDRFI